MNRFVCLHGHFYQPPRENPWLEEVELQDSAYPFHDWNSRITAECYAPNTASRILDDDRRIVDIVNNYSRISFNFGPTLLSWMERHEPATYAAVIEAHQLSKERFNGHGSALAQAYNHLIMPLANSRDKRTQIVWGIRDFQQRFGDRPEGIWLAETAADIETLELCAEYGIRFTILAPRQAKRVRKIGAREWHDVGGDAVDPRRAYRCSLPSGKHIALFFYDGPVSQDVAFGGVLDDGHRFARRLLDTFDDQPNGPQFVHVATDGETYGHHHRFGDMALAYCLYSIEQTEDVELTIYADFLDRYPPEWEAEIFENSSWSCVHGVERWRSDCGCNSGGNPGWQQQWRATLRGAMDWLRDSLALIYVEHSEGLVDDPWKARDGYIDVVLNRTDKTINRFMSEFANGDPSAASRVNLLKLLEMQRHAMLMYTSCGWFFDEISGIETTQVIRYAARAMQLAREVSGIDLEPAYIRLLERAPSNIPDLKDGADIYRRYVQPGIVDMARVGAHYAVSSLFSGQSEADGDIYAYHVRSESFERRELGRQRVVVGKAMLKSQITFEETPVHFGAVHLGEQNLLGGVRRNMPAEDFQSTQKQILDAFEHSNLAEVMFLINEHLGDETYSLSHLFKDEQREVMRQIIEEMLVEVEHMYRQAYHRHYALVQATSGMNIPLPQVLSTTVSFVLNSDIRQALSRKELDLNELSRLFSEAKRLNVDLEQTRIAFLASEHVNALMEALQRDPENISLMQTLEQLLTLSAGAGLDLDVWQAQNRYFKMAREGTRATAAVGAPDDHENATPQQAAFDRLAHALKVSL
jgi:alpha-amylase/alpha-mannosidase (GH57 family)